MQELIKGGQTLLKNRPGIDVRTRIINLEGKGGWRRGGGAESASVCCGTKHGVCVYVHTRLGAPI